MYKCKYEPLYTRSFEHSHAFAYAIKPKPNELGQIPV